MRRAVLLLLALAALSLAVMVRWPHLRSERVEEVVRKARGRKTVEDRLAEYGPAARERLRPSFERDGVVYPPERLVLVGLKAERRLEVYAAEPGGPLRFVRAYPVLGASGGPGPKLREGDGQVPEGVYAIESLNPNSRYHLALRVTYPNAFDREMGARDGREQLGSDIMIHGGAASIGCLAMGDEAAEDLFVLAADTGVGRIQVVLAPRDLRRRRPPRDGAPAWAAALYGRIAAELRALPPPG